MMVTHNLILTGCARCQNKSAGQRQTVMGKTNVAEKINVDAQASQESAQPTMTVVKDKDERIEEAGRKLSLEERIQRVEDLSMMIDRLRNLTESRRKLQTFQIGADSLSSVISLRDANGNEFKTSNSAVITGVVDVMKRTLDVKIAEVEQNINF
jgi:uncharacterized FlaG/YvyC family protein